MDNSLKITWIIVGAIVVLAVIVGFSFGNLGSDKTTVQVTGSSVIDVTPDQTSVYFTVETDGNTSKEAKDANNVITNRVLTALMAEGFERDEIKTSNFNVWEDYRRYYDSEPAIKEPDPFDGYRASHTIVVEITDEKKGKIGEVIDAGINAGANLNYINFELSEETENEYKILAIKEATKDAKEKADALADGLGKKVGDLVSVTSSDFGYYPWLAYEKSGADSVVGAEVATNIVPTDQEVRSSVTVIYEIW